MQPFTVLTGPAAPLLLENVDTDMIIPKQFLTTIHRTGLGRHLFHDLRFTPEGEEVPAFLLNRAPYREARILLAGNNFGCGSSREHAPWALADFGIRCIIAPSFADIFFGNCIKNGLLPVVLDRAAIARLAEAPGPLTVDLEEQEVRGEGVRAAFTLDPSLKLILLGGLDDIAATARCLPAIEAFEAAQRNAQPWLYATS